MDEAQDCWRKRVCMSTPCASARFRFAREVADFIDAHERIFVVEQNRDAQMRTLLIDRSRRRPGPIRRRSSTLTARRSPPASSTAKSPRACARRPPRNFRRSSSDYLAKPKFHHPAIPRSTRSASPAATTKARFRRSAPAAATTRSARRSCAPASNSACRRTVSPS